MKVLLIGSGGREHALAWKIAQSPLLTKLYAAPGNPGIAEEAELVALDADDHGAVVAFCKDKAIDFVVVGPEAPLVAGIADRLREAGIAVFGPSAAAAQLEGSKGFTKDVCARFNIPTGAYQRFNNAPKAKAYVREQGAPIVIKADGLAAGKGVTVAMTLDEALKLWVPGPYNSYLAATLAEAVRQELLEEGQTFTFETVMSHRSKIDFMRAARARGYRVYLYFVATDDPAINIDRVHRRVLQGGHPVADDKVIDRYHKSISLMTEACEVAHRAYIFDNSGSRHKLLAEVTDFDEIRLGASVINAWFLKTQLWKIFS